MPTSPSKRAAELSSATSRAAARESPAPLVNPQSRRAADPPAMKPNSRVAARPRIEAVIPADAERPEG